MGVREALARSQKALYEKTVEEGRTAKVPASNLARYESDDEDRPAVPPPATASYASLRSTEERHREIMNRRLQRRGPRVGHCQGAGGQVRRPGIVSTQKATLGGGARAGGLGMGFGQSARKFFRKCL